MKKIEEIELRKKALNYRKKILSLIVNARASHIGSSYSAIDLLVYLYEKFLNLNTKNINSENRDRFILSKGWAISALYVVLSGKGIIDEELLDKYCQNGSSFIGTSTRNGIAGIEATTGSMGHGLPIGVGMALASRLKKTKNKIVVLMSDGECDEGSVWEAALQAGHHKLDNLILIIDHNKLQSFGRVKEILDLNSLVKKWEAFNWSVQEIDGHNFNEIDAACAKSLNKKGMPSVIIAHTIKGKGVSIFEDRNEWHYKTPNEAETDQAMKELHL